MRRPATASPGVEVKLVRLCSSLALHSFLNCSSTFLALFSRCQSELTLQQPCQGRADQWPKQGVGNLLEVVSLGWYKSPFRSTVLPDGEFVPAPLCPIERQDWKDFTASGASPTVLSLGREAPSSPGERYLGWGRWCNWHSATPEALASGTAGQINSATWLRVKNGALKCKYKPLLHLLSNHLFTIPRLGNGFCAREKGSGHAACLCKNKPRRRKPSTELEPLQPDARSAAGCPLGARGAGSAPPPGGGSQRAPTLRVPFCLVRRAAPGRPRPIALTPSPPAAHPQPPPSDLPGEARRSLSRPQVSPPATPPFPPSTPTPLPRAATPPPPPPPPPSLRQSGE